MVKIVCAPGGPGISFFLAPDSRSRFPDGAGSVLVEGDLEQALQPERLRKTLVALAPEAQARESMMVVSPDGKQIRYVEVL